MGRVVSFDLAIDADEWASVPELQREAIKRYAPKLKAEPSRVGERIQRERIPKRFRHFPNLYRLALPDGWRALYTIRVRKDVPPGVRIVFVGDHKRYDRLFGYRS